MTKSVSSLMALSDTITKLEEINREYAKAIEANKVLIDKGKETIIEMKKSEDYKLDLLNISTTIKSKNLMRGQELLIYKRLINCKKIQEKFFICPQVPIKAFIAEKEEKKEGSYSEVFNLYNQLYVDFLLISKKDACPFAVLEFNGEGHYSKNDKIKEKLFKMANLYYIELNFSEIQDSSNSKLIDIHRLDKYLERLEYELCKIQSMEG